MSTLILKLARLLFAPETEKQKNVNNMSGVEYKLRSSNIIRLVRDFLIRWGWHYFASTCFIGLFAFANFFEGYMLLFFPLSGIIVLIIAYLIPTRFDQNVESDSGEP